jgi:hypothetical protein
VKTPTVRSSKVAFCDLSFALPNWNIKAISSLLIRTRIGAKMTPINWRSQIGSSNLISQIAISRSLRFQTGTLKIGGRDLRPPLEITICDFKIITFLFIWTNIAPNKPDPPFRLFRGRGHQLADRLKYAANILIMPLDLPFQFCQFMHQVFMR